MFNTRCKGHGITESSITGYNGPPCCQLTVATPLHIQKSVSPTSSEHSGVNLESLSGHGTCC